MQNCRQNIYLNCLWPKEVLHKSWREVWKCWIFLLCDRIWKKIFWYFQIWNFFLYWFIKLARYLSNNDISYHYFLNPWQGGGGRSEKHFIPPSWLNLRIPMLESSSNCFTFWDSQYVLCIDLRKSSKFWGKYLLWNS